MVYGNKIMDFMAYNTTDKSASNHFSKSYSEKANNFKDVFFNAANKSEAVDKNIKEEKNRYISAKMKNEPKYSEKKMISEQVEAQEEAVKPEVLEKELKKCSKEAGSQSMKEIVEFFAQATGMDTAKIEDILSGQPDDMPEQEQLDIINALVMAMNKETEIPVSEKLSMLEKMQSILEQLTVGTDEQGKVLQKELVSLLEMLKQEITGAKQELEGLAKTHEVVQKGINQAALDANAHQASQQNTSSSNNINVDGENEVQSNAIVTEAKELENKQESHQDQNGEADKGASDLAGKVKVVNLQSNHTNNQQPPVAFNEVMEIKGQAVTVETVKNSVSTMTAEKTDVFKQVVESAKVVVQEGKSEMTVQLKPDHLGKLSLEIVSERGVMVARFIAESQQVKEIIESSLPQLKDALESQGLNVQGFSVSVGDYSAQRQAFAKGNTAKTRRVLSHGSDEMVTASGYSPDRVIVNPYEISESSVDFTA